VRFGQRRPRPTGGGDPRGRTGHRAGGRERAPGEV